MSRSGGMQKQVNPKVAALLILVVLGVVQWAWWRGLVYQEPGKPGGGGGGGAPRPGFPGAVGSEYVTVDTLTGMLEPGTVDGPGYAASFDRPTGMTIDRQDVMTVADTGNHRIRQVTLDGKTTTLSGSEAGYADGPTSMARFNSPCGVAAGPDGAIYVADTGNHCIRVIKNGQVTTLIGKPAEAETAQGKSVQEFSLPAGIAYVAATPPYLLVADTGHKQIAKVDLNGKLLGRQNVSGAPVSVIGVSAAIPQSGTLLIGTQTLRDTPFAEATAHPGDPNPFTLRNPLALTPTKEGWLVTDSNHAALLRVRDGKAQVLAGMCSSGSTIRGWRDGDGSKALFGAPYGIVTDSKGRIYISDVANNNIRRITLPEGGI